MFAEAAAVQNSGKLRELASSFQRCEGWDEIVAGVMNHSPVTIDSVWGSSCALLGAALVQATGRGGLFVFPSEKQAEAFVDDWPLFSALAVENFPTVDDGHLEDIATDARFGQRLRLLKKLAARSADRQLVVATSIQALSHPLPSPAAILAHSMELAAGGQFPIARVRDWLETNAWRQVPAVRIPGEFAMRGGILDLFAPDWSAPARIEWFDDTIESIRFFEVETQRSTQRCSALNVAGMPTVDEAGKSHFAEFLPENFPVTFVEPEESSQHSRHLVSAGAAGGHAHSFAEIQRSFFGRSVVMAGRLVTQSDLPHFRFPSSLIEPFTGDMEGIRREVDLMAGDRQLFLLATSESELRRIAEILKTTRTAAEDRLHLLVGQLHAGFRLEHAGIACLGSDQLFDRRDVRRRAVRAASRALDSFVDLQPGDLIVHLAHGIGRFRGLKLLDKDGQHTEHLELEFHGGTRIYLPASKFELVQKYVGGSSRRPQLAKIGNKSWLRQKQAATEAVIDLAADMLQLQARRVSRPGIAFGPDTAWQYEFEHSFPWQETPDQLSAIEEVKRDMEASRPMDRLICGDVGFGKTEVAMRAAFKAVENGYQVAVLVPTTILAEQHYRTFRERMAGYPVDIAKLSRFCSPAEQRETLERLEQGGVDIVIGTHRIASQDVKFRNAGLIIIDEEQKFGVEHKERLKSIRAEVDVLTMSATPIPRTLHMSLVGVRDISSLETPPTDRTAVQTRVTRYSDTLIRDSILRELERDGQVYFVHNRIADIDDVARRIRTAVPEARVEIGHGQMPEEELERTMTRFIRGEFDVLVATTIVENGLDIPNANTMFIDEANRYGLSDLHQLRGRVGRYKNQAWCYLLIEPRLHINPNAVKRLHAIEKHSELGSGFSIAMRDLEIRGAGNLLGTEQSGHIAAVGYELYCQLLENAVRALRKEPAPISIDVDIDLPVEAWLPDNYVEDGRQKISLYRRLCRISSFQEATDLRKEMRDRFGKLPAPAARLITLAEIRLEAALWQISHIWIQEKYLGFRFRDPARMQQLVRSTTYPLRVTDDSTAFITLKSPEIPPDQLMALLKSVLRSPAPVS
jgi:transcription-repair coupling factor (superfamily II helicase)